MECTCVDTGRVIDLGDPIFDLPVMDSTLCPVHKVGGELDKEFEEAIF